MAPAAKKAPLAARRHGQYLGLLNGVDRPAQTVARKFYARDGVLEAIRFLKRYKGSA